MLTELSYHLKFSPAHPYTPHYLYVPSTPCGVVLTAELGRRVKMAKEWETEFMDMTELFQQAMKVFLWEGCLRMIKCCGANEPIMVKNLIR